MKNNLLVFLSSLVPLTTIVTASNVIQLGYTAA